MNEQASWPFEIAIDVIFRDLDAMGHVNNAVYFTYMETARTNFFAQRLALTDPGVFPVIVARATCTYLSPLLMGETVRVRMGVSRIGRRSFEMAYLMSADDGRHVARAETAMVTYDYQLQQAIPIPESLRSILELSLSPPSVT